MQRFLRRKTNRPSGFAYDALEPKKLLAAVTIVGTSGDDALQFTMWNGNRISYTLNNESFFDVDVSDGLLIDLKGGINSVEVDPGFGDNDFTANVEIRNAFEIEMRRGDNAWQVRDGLTRLDQDQQGLFGSINQNITFFGAQKLVGGPGSDTFNIYSLKVGTIFGGMGDDVFRFGRGEIGSEFATVDGDSGDDFFAVHGKLLPNLVGGAGLDRVFFKVSDMDELKLHLNNYEGTMWMVDNRENELIGSPPSFAEVTAESFFGLARGENMVIGNGWAGGNGAPHSPDLVWVIEGNSTRATIAGTQQTTFLHGFTSFGLGRHALDSFYVKSTAADLDIRGANFVQISSHSNPELGNLDGIKHLVNIGKIRHQLSGFLATQAIDPVVEHPTTIISNQAGTSSNYLFSHKNSRFDLTGISGGGTIRLAQGGFDSFQEAHFDFNLFGSGEQDRFVFESAPRDFQTDDRDDDGIGGFGEPATSSSFQIYGLGGDDSVLFGGAGSNSKSVDKVRVAVSFFGGGGTDRFIINNQDAIPSADTDADTRLTYHIENGKIVTGSDLRQPGAIFDDTNEIVRINGASNHPNLISIVPSRSARFSVFAADRPDIEDNLSIGEVDGFFEDLGDEVGYFRPDGDLLPVYFEGIDLLNRYFARPTA